MDALVASYPSLPGGTLVVKKSSFRGIPLFLMASAHGCSLRYTLAESSNSSKGAVTEYTEFTFLRADSHFGMNVIQHPLQR